MNRHFLVLVGILAVSQARPESGYNYPRQTSTLQINGGGATSYQQTLPQIAAPDLQRISLSQSQQSSSYQNNIPAQLSVNQPAEQYKLSNIPSQAVSQPGLPQASGQIYNPPQVAPIPQQYNFGQNQGSSSYQQIIEPSRYPSVPISPAASVAQASLPRINYVSPQLVHVFPNLNNNFNIPQNIQQLPVQTQGQIFVPNFQIQQNSILPQSLANFVSQNTFNQLPQGEPQQVVAPIGPGRTQLTVQQFANGLPDQAPIITKHVYVHVAPEEPPLPPQVISAPPPPRKTYKIIFIKAPSQSSQRQIIHVPAPQAPPEEKTLVYVLVDKPQQPQIVVPAPAPTQPSKPEVYFIKYKANSQIAVPASASVSSTVQDASVQLNEEPNHKQLISSGESTSSLFSGGVPSPNPSYGPPAYQKRNA